MFALPTKPDRWFRHFGICQERSGRRLHRRFLGGHSCAPAFRTGSWSLFHYKFFLSLYRPFAELEIMPSLPAAGGRGFRIRDACMGIGLPDGMPELVRIHRCKKNYAGEPRKYKPGGHSFSDS
jgi:hypothetical protein